MLTPLSQIKSDSLINIVNQNIKEEKKNKNRNYDLNHNDILQIKGKFKILTGNSNIYERSKKGILRKNN